MRASSTFNFELGRSTRECFAREALRILVSKSAIGSVVILPRPCFTFPALLHFHFYGSAGLQSLCENSRILIPVSRTHLINNLPRLSDAASGAKAPRWRCFTAGLKPRPSAGGIYEMASNLRNTVFPGAN